MLRRTHYLLLVLSLLAGTFWLGSARGLLAAPGGPFASQAPAAFMPYLSYYFAAGSSLYSADYTMRGDYQPGGCVSALDSGGQFFTQHLNLPQGARIDYLRLFYYDADAATNSTANIRVYDAAGGYVELASVSSAGSAGYGSTLSGFVGDVVDNYNGAYVLNWMPNATSANSQLCGLRVAYRVEAKQLFLPLVTRQ
jgi:hypothetical protein